MPLSPSVQLQRTFLRAYSSFPYLKITQMGVPVENDRIGVEREQLLARLQRAFCGKTASLKYEKRGAIRPRKGRRLQKARGGSSSRQSMSGCWKTIIPEPTRLKIGKIFGCHAYEKVAGETETAPFLSRD